MSPNKAEGLKVVLEELMGSSPEIEAAAIISADGLPMASVLPAHLDEDRLSAMAAAMLSLGERASENLGRGRLHQVFVEGSSGYVFLMAAGPAVLCAITRYNAKIGLVIYEMRRSATAIASLFEMHEERERSHVSSAPAGGELASAGGPSLEAPRGDRVIPAIPHDTSSL